MVDKIRIKDIAQCAGVSVGTVDRVLHNRPNVSPKARIKVEKALKDMDYQPNMYASALAVSYTHLDVYKRQAFMFASRAAVIRSAEVMAEVAL